MTTPLEKSHRELYEALKWFLDDHDNAYGGEPMSVEMYEFLQRGCAAIKNAEKIIKGER